MSAQIRQSTIPWQALNYFNLYRFLIAFLFVSLVWIGHLPVPLGEHNQLLFAVSCHLYLFATLFLGLLIKIQFPRYNLQIAGHTLIDIIIISLMMYSSGGLDSGFGMLLVIAVAGGSILRAGKIAILFAAIASIVVLCQELYFEFVLYSLDTNYTHAGFLGITFFITAILGHVLANQVQQSEELAKQRAVDVENLSLLNEFIIQRMHSGVIVLDEKYRIRMLNEAAKNLLSLKSKITLKNIDNVLPVLAKGLRMWQEDKQHSKINFKPDRGNVDLQASFTRLNPDARFGVLIFLEDVSILQQRAQQLKVNSLGRLAASIAHEVRNPLGAISHASQLLSESKKLDDEDNHLIGIIMQHSKRVNTIIENTMKISRREPSVAQLINIKDWLDAFIVDFTKLHDIDLNTIEVSVNPDNLTVNVDPGQLHQILMNLSENAIRYSKKDPLLKYVCSINKDNGRAYIKVIDQGTGIPENKVEHLFEPFFTTESGGSGLGLYIARELCEANLATLELERNLKNGCTFRINFANVNV